MTKHDLEKEMNSFYEEMRKKWFPMGTNRAKLTVEFPSSDSLDFTSGYFIKEDRIKIVVAEGDFLDFDNVFNQGWPIWKREIAHEMCHEYQHKCVTTASPTGIALYDKYRNNNFPGNGHDETFYTAIAEIAKTNEITAENFIEKI